MSEKEPQFGEEPEQERISSFSRITGASREEEKNFLEVPGDKFKEQKFQEWEKEKTPEEKEIVDVILEKLPEFVKQFGGRPLKLTAEHVHIIDPGKLNEEEKKKNEKVKGRFNETKQMAEVFPDVNQLKFAQAVIHEVIHFSSFQSLTLKRGTESGGKDLLAIRKSGLAIRNHANDFFFDEINEAMTDELSQRFEKKYFGKIPTLKDDLMARDAIREKIKGKYPELGKYTETTDPVTGEPLGGGYSNARIKLNNFLGNIYARNIDRFSSQKEVFEIFAKAYFTGRTLSMARLVEKTFGKGSFRGIGKETKKFYAKKK
ncbi:hypothetical protein KKE19_01520 [Patescibacteria group bacterium]|nr:hypothetical protein [Patescibacteria group bacterium]MBU4274472.1 hypothetical protein [Patescibacteria group bacterium]MBU4367929.1 hypothetical protein [Patescibacteria group bacterium]MBU4462267.1 hypothetical protein [Patescibacteria group bacterium]MCG2699539.1 hypothetical protein [Candidatus Parcubacteria bacterium]